MPLTIDLSIYGPGTFYIEDDGTAGNNRSRVRDETGNVLLIFDHPSDQIKVLSKAGQDIVVDFLDSLSSANLLIGNTDRYVDSHPDPNPNPDNIYVNNIVTTGFVELAARNLVAELGEDAAADITAQRIGIRANGGVGSAGNHLEFHSAIFAGESGNGSLFIAPLSQTRFFVSGTAYVEGLQVGDGGIISIFADATVSGLIGRGLNGHIGVPGAVLFNFSESASFSDGTALADVRLGGINGDLDLDVPGHIRGFTMERTVIGNITADVAGDFTDASFSATGEVILNVAGNFSGSATGLHGATLHAGGSVSGLADGQRGDVLVTTGGDSLVGGLSQDGAVTVIAPGTLGFSGRAANVISLTADDIIIAPSSNASTVVVADRTGETGLVTIQPFTSGRRIELGESSDPGAMKLSDAELDKIWAKQLVVGDAEAGSISVVSGVSVRDVPRVRLVSGADIDIAGNMSLTLNEIWGSRDLALVAGGNVNVSSTVTVDNFTATTGAFGTAGAPGGILMITGTIVAKSISLNGGAGDDSITGSAAAESIDGGLGADFMSGLGGNDIYIVDNAGDVVVEGAGHGSNDVIFTSVDWQLRDDVHVETLSAASWESATPLALTGNFLANYLIGNAGDNILNGGAGADVMVGREGNDAYLIDHVDDYVFELEGEGHDGIYTSVSYRLRAGLEIETLSTLSWESTAALDLTGNEFANYIIGNAGANVIDGGAGADVLVGREGDDAYIVDHARDHVEEAAGQGHDGVYTKVSYTLGAGQEIETLSTFSWEGTAAIDLTGNEFSNYIIGNAGSNLIDGKGGNDVLVGREGADTFAFTTALGSGNIDFVSGFESGSDKFALDDAVFQGLAPGALPAGAFRLGAAAQDADDQILYDPATGAIYFDADGSGAGAAVWFASVEAGTVLVASDFTVI